MFTTYFPNEINREEYHKKHVDYMKTIIFNYPGIDVTEVPNGLILNVTEEAFNFLCHMQDCQMLELWHCFDYDDEEEE